MRPKIKISTSAEVFDYDTWYHGLPTETGVYERDYSTAVVPLYCRFDGSNWYVCWETLSYARKETVTSDYHDLPWRKVRGETYYV
jgi:hypothetical protein